MKKVFILISLLPFYTFSSDPSSSSTSEERESSGYTLVSKLNDWWKGHYAVLLEKIRAGRWHPSRESTDDIHRAERAIEGGIKKNDPEGVAELLSFCRQRELPINQVYLERVKNFFSDKLQQEKAEGVKDIKDICARLQQTERMCVASLSFLGIEQEPKMTTASSTLMQLHKEKFFKD
jgi:hypothetical protein